MITGAPYTLLVITKTTLAHTYKHTFVTHLYTEQSIARFMDVFQHTFPSATIPPKMHMLEDHTMEWVRVCNVGFGLLGNKVPSPYTHDLTPKDTY